jgi:hypothetical protein
MWCYSSSHVGVVHFMFMFLLISRGGVLLFTWVLLLFLHGCYCSHVLMLFFLCIGVTILCMLMQLLFLHR